MGAVDLQGRLREWVTAAIDNACMGEEFWFDTDSATVMTPAGPAIQYTIVIMMKNPLLNAGPIIMPFSLGMKAMREDAVILGVNNTLGQLRQAYRQILDSGPQALPGAGNGLS